jgi:hypothetical protein
MQNVEIHEIESRGIAHATPEGAVAGPPVTGKGFGYWVDQGRGCLHATKH